MDLIKVSNLKKSFKGASVLEDVSFALKENEILGLIGPNGAGKTVLTKIISGQLKQDEGEIELNGNFAIQFQDPKMNNNMKVKELITFTKKLHEDEIINDTTEAEKIFGIDKLLNKPINKISGGQQQRLNLFLAIIRKTNILFLDEFTTGMDISAVEKILNYLKRIQKENNMSIILISHQPDEIRRLSDRIILLKDGVIKKEFKTKTVETKYKDSFYKFLLEHIGEKDE